MKATSLPIDFLKQKGIIDENSNSSFVVINGVITDLGSLLHEYSLIRESWLESLLDRQISDFLTDEIQEEVKSLIKSTDIIKLPND